MLSKVLFLAALSLAVYCGLAAGSDPSENSVEKRSATNKPNYNVVKALKEAMARIKTLESKVRGLKHGTPGIPGMPGRPGVRGQRGYHGHPGPKSGGVQYVRWGRTTCPSGATRVYKGRVGGEWYEHTGGASNYVCLTESPKYGIYSPGIHIGGHMYGAEYQEGDTYNPFSTNVYQDDVPCAVCYVKIRNTELMIPATNDCPAGWTREYWGYLMAERYDHKNQKGFVCVDKDAESVPGSKKNVNGALLYTVEGRCGTLPCPPYVNKRELTCAVCTK